MEISIVIVNFNTAKLIRECINSISKYPPRVSYEIIVVDNGSDEKLEIRDKNIKIINNKENLGFARANNQGIKVAKGSYILLLNSDTEVKKGSIDALLDFARKNKEAGVVVPKLLNSDGSVQGSAFRFPGIWLAVREYWLGEKGLFNKYIPGKGPVDVAVMAGFLITPQVLNKVGLLDERYFFFFEDFDYCKRIKEAGFTIYYLPEAEVVHHHGASGEKIATWDNQWRRLIPGSKLYHGPLMHYLIFFVMWTSQKWKRLLNQN